jgi:hypothetical protein
MTMSIDKQFSVFLVNKPGILAQVTQSLADQKVNIKALTLVDSQEHGVLRIVAENGERAGGILRTLNIPVTETDVLCVEMANHPGALADVCSRLALEHVNINYAYLSTGTKGGKTIGVFKVSDMNKAKRVLEVRKPQRRLQPVRRASGKV